MNGFVARWKQWWAGRSLWQRVWPILALSLYWAVLLFLDGVKFDLVIASLLPTVLYYAGPDTRAVNYFLLPFFLTAILYDSQRYYADYIRGPIHVREPYDFDKRFFGIATDNGVLTPNEWWQLHTHGILDFFTGIAYIVFIPVFIATAAYFRFYLSRTGTRLKSAQVIRMRSPQVMWSFMWLNLIGWSTYYWYAASPPWYVALHGFGPARTDIPANIAGCARFDALIGIPIFSEWYSHSADVHGAIPSLHIAYPLVAVYYAFRFGGGRVFTTSFFLLMCFAAVYLNHHYVLDVIWGMVYALGVAFAMDMYWNHKLKKEHRLAPNGLVEA